MASDAAVPSEIELPPPDHESRENAKTRTVVCEFHFASPLFDPTSED
jgi:hypothetical protein